MLLGGDDWLGAPLAVPEVTCAIVRGRARKPVRRVSCVRVLRRTCGRTASKRSARRWTTGRRTAGTLEQATTEGAKKHMCGGV